ncbi:PilZ domain-containing protein [Mucisphaera calidilacus]|uniref:PilZ domain protein n=1 Tax=Mucisphaera calidilacus TaxID=2527982 RepID=A0A518BZE0_9BACT|nr:PilZ domain-containing protein [Mucisphaera calidilacus]QDU72342.1 PilZ domain protein [Mucisphaera calidilacus]
MIVAQSHDLLDTLNALEDLRSNEVSARRAFQRFVVRGDAQLLPMDRNHLDPNPIPIHLRDISRGGLGFITTAELDVNSSWRVVFYHHGFPVGEQGLVVRHSRRVEAGLHLVGGQFVVNSGVLSLLGIDPSQIDDEDQADIPAVPGDFRSPE